MKTNTKRGIALAAATLMIAGIGGSAFGAGTDHQIRKSDFIAGLSDTRDTGAYGFGPKGLVLRTNGSASSDKVAEYYAASGALPDSGSQDWTGSSPEPGKQIVFDADNVSGNGNDFNILVGEPVYGDNWWLTNGSSSDAKAADPSGANDGGNGSQWFGTLAEWKAALPNAQVKAYGFSLGSGVKGDGVLVSQTFGDDKYAFEDDAASTPAVTPEAHTASAAVSGGAVSFTGSQNRLAVVKLTSAGIPANDTGRGKKISWSVRVNGSTRFSSTMGWGEVETSRILFSKDGGSRKVEVYRNGVKVATKMVTTN